MTKTRSKSMRARRAARRRKTAVAHRDGHRAPAAVYQAPAGSRADLEHQLRRVRGRQAPPGRIKRALWWCMAAFTLAGAAATGTFTVSAAGWAGTPGVLTAQECRQESNGKGGHSTVCSGVFVSDDGRSTDPQASMVWHGGEAGDSVRVRTVAPDGYQQQGADEVGLLVTLTGIFTLAGTVCGFTGLSRTGQDRLASHLPDRAFARYVNWQN
ncbi:hypothetical protein CUT44_08805 [Streptomyces carminius]|uniref:Uncharacterized protein n=1 Tax=Streptomyces carminius TaxID=2665496 RepID=A0A2M8M1R5_9ACTN|nr:hypothetical protein [Streptomyces carminius]PJE98141.1 hypothetical protein CUT44_08805 [Streptomyces carminius]